MTTIIQTLKTLALAAILSVGISVVYAWTDPTSAPTGGTTSAPLNASIANQSKDGTLTLSRIDGLQAFETYGKTLLSTVTGNVGIATTSPSQKLSVAGTGYFTGGIKFSDGTTQTSAATSVSGGTTGYIPKWASASSLGNSLIYDNGTSVAIGTTAPLFKFEVYGDGARSKFTNTNTANISNVMVLQNNSTKGYSSMDFYDSNGIQKGFMGYGNASALSFTDKIYIGAINKDIIIQPGTANVGIGTTAPGAKLEVNGNILQPNSNTLNSKNSAGTAETWMWPRWSDNIMYTNFGSAGWNIRNNSSTNVMFLQNGGNVGIGTTNPLSKLSVGGDGSNSYTIYAAISGSSNSDTAITATNSGSGRGVAGYNSSGGIGVYGQATGSGGYGVYGSGGSGYGVYGSSSTGNYGVYGQSGGSSGYGVWGTNNSTGGTGVKGTSSGSSGYGVAGVGGRYGVFGSGTTYDFYASGAGTTGTNYGPFTGGHEVKLSDDSPKEIKRGLIISTTGKTEARKDDNGEISLSSTLPTVKLTDKVNDKTIFGIFVSETPLPEDHWYKSNSNERFGTVNALGEGRVWVSDINGDIQAGDYITSSLLPGYGQKQDDDLLHNYTVGKAIENVEWNKIVEKVFLMEKNIKFI